MTTNQAFIKAYRRDAAEPTPARPASTAQLASTVEYVAAAADQVIAAYDTRLPLQKQEAHAQAALPGRTGRGEPSTSFPACDTPFGRVNRSLRSASIGKRPLSAYTTRRRSSPGPITDAKFEPATTVASFAWPGICRTLCQQCAPQYDRIADRLVREAELGRPTIGLAGLFPQVGATTTILCIAARLAARKQRAIVVEGNFLAPRLAAWLDAAPTAWWQDVLEHGVPTADAVVRAADDRLDLLPLEARPSDALLLAASGQAAATSQTLREAYDLVLVDLGPFFDPTSQPILLELVRSLRIDSALAVTPPQGGDQRDINTLAEYLEQSGCNLLGTIENRAAKD